MLVCKADNISKIGEEMEKDNLNQELFNKIFEYDPQTGKVFWKTRYSPNSRCVEIGKEAGGYRKDGYLQVALGENRILIHRLIWVMIHGYWPDQIDHINQIRDDNSLDNLREVSNRINMRNATMKSNNTSGVTGVDWDKSKLKWRSQITFNGKNHSKRFNTFEEAVSHRKEMEIKFGFHKNHGSRKNV